MQERLDRKDRMETPRMPPSAQLDAAPNPSTAPFPGRARDLLPPAQRELRAGELLVNELFRSIQGESSFVGWPCFFIRLTGCHLRCSYCDSTYAFLEGQRMTLEAIVQAAERSGCSLVELTGGEPLLQRAALPLLTRLCDRDLTVLLETSGTVPLHRVDPRVRKIVDVKTPSSGMVRYNLTNLAPCLGPHDELKLVVGDREDYVWARGWLATTPWVQEREIAVHFSPVHGRLEPGTLAGWILEDGLAVRLGVQLHKVLWPDRERGI